MELYIANRRCISLVIPMISTVFFSETCEDIFCTQNCTIYYNTERDIPWTEEDAEIELGAMSLFVIPFSDKFLSEENEPRCFELRFALEHHIPVLPIMREKRLEEKFNKICGNIQVLDGTQNNDPTVIPYKNKLERRLSSVLTKDEIVLRIRNEFCGHIFLSYRKKDRKFALELMHLIHQLNPYRDLAIWYDEFLVPGEDFNESIQESIEKSDMVAFTITPNILEKDNYVMKYEYPQAKATDKPVLPAEMDPTDRYMLDRDFPGIPEPVNARSSGSLLNKLQENLNYLDIMENDHDPKHLLLIGIAYLQGIDVEKNSERGFTLISQAAESGDAEAQCYLGHCYDQGQGTAVNSVKAAEWYLAAAEQGNPEAQYSLAWCYLSGRGVEEDAQEAYQWFEKAAEGSLVNAQEMMAEAYYTGHDGPEQNYEKAFFWSRKAAEQDIVSAQSRLGDCYAGGKGVKQNYEKAIGWWTKAADNGSSYAAYQIGLCYYNGQGFSQSYEKAVEWWKKAAEDGLDYYALYQLGLCCYNGQGTERNLSEAEKYFEGAIRKCYFDFYDNELFEYETNTTNLNYEKIFEFYTRLAMDQARFYPSLDDILKCDLNQVCSKIIEWDREEAEEGDAGAQFNLGLCYAYMQGEEQNDEKAAYWYEKAAEQGSVDAQLTLASFFAKIKELDHSREKAVYWYRKAADGGSAEAQYRLGWRYNKGLGITQDYKKAAYWYRKAADQGQADAQLQLGKCFYFGNGVNQDYVIAAEWYAKAAEQGNAEAQYNLGLMYADGQGVEQSYERAVACWEKVSNPNNYFDDIEAYMNALFHLCDCYVNGLGTDVNYEKAVNCYQRLAQEGVANAQYILGCCYDEGKGVAKDPEEAEYWWRYAAGQGHEGAIEKLNLHSDTN